ncbi:MAG: GntR family transcriptional regulator [Treponemataceae bacterium]
MLKQITVLPIRERVASELRNAIFSGGFAAGDELGQDFLAEKLGVSRMPIREALQILAGEGLIELRTNRGAIVKDISKDYIREHFELRLVLECDAIAKACERMTDFSELEFIHEEQRKAIDAGDMNQTNLCNQAFHMHIWDNAGNSRMKGILVQLWNGLSIGTVVLPAVHARKSFEEHGLMIEALREKQADVAKVLMTRHILRSMENMMMRPANTKTA